ncbi:MAG: WD40 repeat domain-containing protein [Gemmatimonadota bacterium]
MNVSILGASTPSTGELVRFEELPVCVHGVQFLSRGDLVALAGFTTVEFRSVWSGTKMHELEVPKGVGPPQALAISPRGDRVLWASYRSGVHLLDARGRSLVGLALSADAERYLSSESPGLGSFLGVSYPDGSYEDWSERYPPYQAVCDIAFSPTDDQCVAAYGQAYALVWDLTTGHLRVLLGREGSAEPPRRIYHVAWSPDGRYVMTRDDRGTMKLWDVETRDEVLSVEAPHDPRPSGVDRPDDMPAALSFAGGIGAIAFSPDSRHLVAGDGEVVRVWSVQTGRLVATWVGHGARHPLLGCYEGAPRIRRVRFSASGERALTVGVDSALRVWDVPSGREIWSTVPDPCCIDHGDLSPDGTHVVWAGCPGVRIYEVG